MTYRILLAVAILTLLTASAAFASLPPPDFGDWPAYLQALNHSRDPDAVKIRRHIADGPAALARERDLARKEGLAVFPAQLNRPLPPPSQNAAPLYVRAAALRQGRVLLPRYAETLSARYTYSQDQLERIQKIYDDNPKVFALLREATDKPQCVFAQDSSTEAPGLPLQQFASLRETARELKTESILLAERGKYHEAISMEKRVYRVAEHAAANPTLISYLVGTAINAIATGGMQDILTLAGPNADVDAQVGLAVTTQSAHLSLRHGLSGEIAMGDVSFEQLRKGRVSDLQSFFTDTQSASPSPKPPSTPGEKKAYQNLLDAAEADYIARMRRVITASDTPDEAAAFAEAGREATAETDDPIKLLSHKLSSFQFDTLNALPLRSAAAREVTRAAAAVLGECAKTGAYPQFLTGDFPDPYSGNPLGYRREGTDGFVVYSAGPDGSFSGGKPGDKSPTSQVLFRYPVRSIPVPPDMLE